MATTEEKLAWSEKVIPGCSTHELPAKAFNSVVRLYREKQKELYPENLHMFDATVLKHNHDIFADFLYYCAANPNVDQDRKMSCVMRAIAERVGQ
jgi:hypothetical protein